MYDTINFTITRDEAGGVDFLSEIPNYLEDVGEHFYKNGSFYISGKLEGLRVRVDSDKVFVGDGSLCKFALGSNYQTMSRRDTQQAIEKLNDMLHLPMEDAKITRLDIAQNFILKHPMKVYLNHLGELKYATRVEYPNGLYYQGSCVWLCFYDKNREQTQHHEKIPDLYKGQNVFRYEQRYLKRLPDKLGVPKVTGGLLYDEVFYMDIENRWRDSYLAIPKINDVTFNIDMIKNTKYLNKMRTLALVKVMGGQTSFLSQIKEHQMKGGLTKKQAFDLRKMIKDACQADGELVVPNDAIQELDKKIIEAVRYYR